METSDIAAAIRILLAIFHFYTPIIPCSIDIVKTPQEIRFAKFVGESDYKTSHIVPPLYWRICTLEILLFGDLEISFIYIDPWGGGV